MEILIDNRQTRIQVGLDEFKNKAQEILEGLGCSPSAMLSISLVDSEEMTYLNRHFRQKDGPTNVLSFPQSEGDETGLQPDLLGDVVICTDRAEEDAVRLGYSNEEMIVYLLIHGILHLTGLTHDQPSDADEMDRKVQGIFRGFFPDLEPVP